MALQSMYRLTSTIGSTLPIIQCRLFHLSYENNARTHNYTSKSFPLPSNKVGDFLERDPMLLDIRKKSGAVIRFNQTETIDATDATVESDATDETSQNLLVVGNPNQIEKAFDALNKLFGNEVGINKKKGVKVDDGDKLLWHGYKRNYKGQYAPTKARKNCIRRHGRHHANICPLCQMKKETRYAVQFTDTEILTQFICPHTWGILDAVKSNLCRHQHQNVFDAIIKARSYGYIPMTYPLPSEEVKKHKKCGIPTDRNIKVKIH